MGTKKEIKEAITRKLEENFNLILNTKDSILNLQNTLSTKELKISMYHIKTFMRTKGYNHNKATNEWNLIDNTEKTPSNNEAIKENDITLKTSIDEVIENKEILNDSLTDGLRSFLKSNSKDKNSIYSNKTSSSSEENTTEKLMEKSLIPDENIIKEIWKITDNTASNCEAILSNLLLLSKQLSDSTLLLSSLNTSNIEVNDNDYFTIPSNEMIDIIHGDTKRYELSLVINFVDAIKKKFFLKHPDITGLDKLKDTKILSMALWDYLTSN